MSGRPDYDAGDLVVCVTEKVGAYSGKAHPCYKKGAVYLVSGVRYDKAERGFPAGWYVTTTGLKDWTSATRFRRIDPKPAEFWTGTVSADAGEGVAA